MHLYVYALVHMHLFLKVLEDTAYFYVIKSNIQVNFICIMYMYVYGFNILKHAYMHESE